MYRRRRMQMKYWWLSLIVFLFFVGLNVVLFLLRKKPKLSYALAYSIAVFLLIYKIGEYIYHQAVGNHMNFPLEFSALSYFLLGITVTFRIKKAEQLGAFTGILAGLMYSITFWVSPNSYVENPEPIYFMIMAIINHHLVYFAGMLLLANSRRYSYKSCWVLFLGVGIMISYSWIIYLFTNYAEVIGKPIIIQICDGSILSWLGLAKVESWIMALYVVLEVLLFIGLLCGFYSINNILANKRKKAGIIDDYYPKKLKDIYKIKD